MYDRTYSPHMFLSSVSDGSSVNTDTPIPSVRPETSYLSVRGPCPTIPSSPRGLDTSHPSVRRSSPTVPYPPPDPILCPTPSVLPL